MIARYHKFALTASIALAMALIFSCSTDTNDGGGSSSNSGGGTSSLGSADNSSSSGGGTSGGGSSSSVLVSGGEDIAKWMKYNLNYEAPEGSTCYSNKAENCTKYGRLYNWAAAMALPQKCNSVLSTSDPECKINTPHHKGLCPAGQHIPTKEEWDALITAAGGASAATKTLKSSDWFNGSDVNCKGSNDYGFAALAGGYGLSDGTFKEIADVWCLADRSGARWWSASEGGDASYAFSRYMPNRNTESIRLNEDNKGDFSSIRCLQDYLSGGSSSSGAGGSSSSAVTGGSSSSGAAQGGVGSCTVSSSGLCAENISQAECIKGTFSAGGTCGAQYTYCLLMESNPVDCKLIGSASMPSKASCPADEDGVKAFANETICGGSKGSCKLQWMELYEFCVDVNRGVCEKLYADSEDYNVTFQNVTFQAGECGTAAEQYPCCLSDDGVEYFIPGSFSKSNCYSKGGTPANASICVDFGN